MGGTILQLRDVRAMFRLIGEVRELGGDPNRWRRHMVKRLRARLQAEIVISSEIHFRPSKKAAASSGIMQVHDLGWGCSGDDETWQIKTVADETPEMFRVSRVVSDLVTSGDDLIPIKPISKDNTGTRFILSQRPLPHLGAVDQLGIHRAGDTPPFTLVEHRLVQLFHSELARLWKRDALRKAKNPDAELPPRLAETLAALQSGCSEKEVSLRLGISQHTVHNYVKALHQRLGVSSRGELLAKVPRADGFVPRLSLEKPLD